MRIRDDLDQYLAEQRGKPFKWGVNDCILFFAGWHEIATGFRHADDWRGRYHDEASAREAIEAGGGLPAIFSRYLGEPCPAESAVRGDAGLMAFEGWHIGMISTGSMWAFKHPTRGVQMIRKAPELAWRIGYA